jgi:signal transduction histidine kinase
VRDALRDRDVRVHDVSRLGDAMLAIASTSFDLILLDLSLPDAAGIDALVTLRREVEGMPIVVLTALESEDIAADALNCGAEDYLLKQELNARSLWRAVRQANLRHEVRHREKDLLLEQASRRSAEMANSLKDEFLVTLSQELRTPLNAVLGWLQILIHRDGSVIEPGSARDPRSPLESILRNTNMLKRLIGDMLDLSYLASGKLHLARDTVAFSLLVETAVEDAAAAAAATGVSLRSTIEPGRTVQADPDRLRQVMDNLLTNAIKYTPRGGDVSITMRSIGDEQVEVIVKDTGVGLAPESIPLLFQRFSQPSELKRGLGIGLSICKDIVTLHGGHVSAESHGLGHGAAFTMVLPTGTGHSEAARPTRRLALVDRRQQTN